MTDHRGLDGLTAEELSASRRGFWDERFTGLLLSFLPASTEVLVDVGCGLAAAAHALLPSLSRARYLGIDADEARLSQAREHLRGVPYAAQVELRAGRAERLPVPDASADVVLTAMALQHLEVPGAGLSEARRVLTAGGVFLSVEPDNLANRFYFDGPLEEVNDAFSALFAAVREKRRPADVAIGPAVPRHAAGAGLEVTGCLPHSLGAIRPGSAGDFLRAFVRVAEVAAASGALLPDDQHLTACRVALAEVRAHVGDDTPGFGGQIVPVFLTVARRAS